MSNSYLIPVFTFLLVFAGTGLGIYYQYGKDENKEQNISYVDLVNWMSKIPDDKKILLMNLPGTHDSAAYLTINKATDKLAQCQKYNISEQLSIGIRLFDIRVAVNLLGKLICAHGEADLFYKNEKGEKKTLLFEMVVNDFKEFLENHKKETVILSTSSARMKKKTNIKTANEIFEKLVPEEMRVKYNRTLTLGDVRGKIIYDFYETDEVDKAGNKIFSEGINLESGLIEIHQNYEDYETYKVNGTLKVEELTDLWKQCDEVTFEDAEDEFNAGNDKYPFRYSLSCTGQKSSILPYPKGQADIVNPFAKSYNFKKGYFYGWMNIDFVDEELSKKIIETNPTK